MNNKKEELAEGLENLSVMKKYRVKQGKPEYIFDWIESLKNSKHKTVKEILNVVSAMLKNPTAHKCLSQNDINKIFKPKKGDWAGDKAGGGFGKIKSTLKNIKDQMFIEDDPDCIKKVIGGSDEW